MAEEQLGPSDGASVVIDIGGEVGAVVLHTPAWLVGDELEMRRKDKDAPPTHTAVRSRHMGTHATWAAVFPAVEAGEYSVHRLKDPAVTSRDVTVIGGQVTEAHW